MAHSRFSTPLFALGLLSVAVCMTYLAVTKNIFGLTSFNNKDEAVDRSYFEEQSVAVAEDRGNPTNSIFDSPKIKKAIASGAKKITGTQEVGATEGSDADVANNSGTATVSETDKAAMTSNSSVLEESIQDAIPQQSYSLKAFWQRYSETVPRLYSHPRDENTETILGRVGQLSLELDSLGYSIQSGSELTEIAIAGEREGARALSFYYAKNNMVESLAWAMIANAIAENDYYLSICLGKAEACSEGVFYQASIQAKNYIRQYNFSLK